MSLYWKTGHSFPAGLTPCQRHEQLSAKYCKQLKTASKANIQGKSPALNESTRKTGRQQDWHLSEAVSNDL